MFRLLQVSHLQACSKIYIYNCKLESRNYQAHCCIRYVVVRQHNYYLRNRFYFELVSAFAIIRFSYAQLMLR
jgi:hypothetical protein